MNEILADFLIIVTGIILGWVFRGLIQLRVDNAKKKGDIK